MPPELAEQAFTRPSPRRWPERTTRSTSSVPSARGAFAACRMTRACRSRQRGISASAPRRSCSPRSKIWRCGLIDYEETSGGLISCARLVLGKPYRYAEHLLPRDGGSRDLSSAEKTRAQLLRDLKLTGVRVLPNDSVATGIEQTRLRLWPHAYFDEDKCRLLLRALESYRAEWNAERKSFALTPRKDWASHGSDSFRYLAMGLRPATLSPRPRVRVPRMVYSLTAPPR